MIDKSVASGALAGSLVSLTFLTKISVLAGVMVSGSVVYMLTERKIDLAEGKSHSKMDMFHSFIVSMFSGVMFFFASVMVVDEWVAGWVAAGVGSFLGFKGLTVLGDRVIDGLFKRR